MLAIDRAMVIEWVTAAVEGNEDFVYSPEEGSTVCSYVHGATYGRNEGWNVDNAVSGCLIGKILLENTDLTAQYIMQNSLNSQDAYELTDHLERCGDFSFTKGAVGFMKTVQGFQDMDNTWGDALRVALEICGEKEDV